MPCAFLVLGEPNTMDIFMTRVFFSPDSSLLARRSLSPSEKQAACLFPSQLTPSHCPFAPLSPVHIQWPELPQRGIGTAMKTTRHCNADAAWVHKIFISSQCPVPFMFSSFWLEIKISPNKNVRGVDCLLKLLPSGNSQVVFLNPSLAEQQMLHPPTHRHFFAVWEEAVSSETSHTQVADLIGAWPSCCHR